MIALGNGSDDHSETDPAGPDSLLRSVMDNAPFGAHMYTLEPDGRLVFIGFNQRAEEILGIDHSKLLGLTLEEAFPGNAGTETAAAYRQIAAEGGFWDTNQYAYDSDGIAGVFEVHAFSFGPNRVSVFFRDVTERMAAEDQLRVYSELLETSPAAITVHALDGACLYANQRALDLHGYSRDEFLRLNLHELDVPEDAALIEERIGRLSGGDPVTFEVAHYRADGSRFPLAVNARLTSWHGRDVILSVATDITERRKAEAELRRNASRLKIIAEASRAFAESSGDYDKVLGEVVEQACESLADMCQVRLLDSAGNRLVLAAVHSRDPELARILRSDLDASDESDLVSQVLRSGESVFVPSITVEQLEAISPPEYRDFSERFGPHSFMITPMRLRGSVIGTLALTRYEPQRPGFEDDDLVTAQELADRAALAVSNARLIEEVRGLAAEREQALAQLEGSYVSIIGVVSQVVEARDPYTAGHERRVAELAEAIASEVGLAPEEIEQIRVAALIHDVGKVSVPAEILSKPGVLTPVEMEIVKGHAEAGYKILSSANLDRRITEIVYQHHERCDGSGYPRGMHGTELNEGAKILMVADVVEAMTSHRPYRAGLGIEAALAEVERGAGLQYDREVVAACTTCFRERGFEFSPSQGYSA